ncbi:MAG: SRPBCC family protein [Actinomycetota bacterium]|nr:SRPBCC family protein [Actinomycetota bacterium]
MTMTTNEQSIVDADAFTVRRTVTIAADHDKVWAAITEPEHIAKWFGDTATLDRLEAGADGTFGWNDYGNFPIRIEELGAPHTIAYRWGNENATPSEELDPDRSTVFRFTVEPLEPDADGRPRTRLTVVESGFNTLADPTAAMESNRGGWNSELDELVAYLEELE